MRLTILYRGPLSSCNYACPYCPFAKHHETPAEHAADERALERLLSWVEGRPEDELALFFTPWGEALIRKRYQRALARLTHMPHVRKAAIQTNLSCSLGWVEACEASKLGIWATYHPGEVARKRFIARCLELDQLRVALSVGVVGLKEHAAEIEALRAELPPHIYLWVNAYKREPGYYIEEDVRRLEAVDPLFPINNTRHRSLGRPCRGGSSVISVDGDGTIRRCHFIREPIGNLYAAEFERALRERPCSNETCGCHIGYVHLDHLGLASVFGDGILERIPVEPIGRGRES